MTEQSLATLSAYRADSDFHVDRFRPNLLLDAADSELPFPEAAWVGQQIRIGEVVLEVVGECPRCSMTTHGFGNLPKDPGIMRALVGANQGNVGVYAKVVAEGSVRVGDTLV